jgi:heme-degrading monooxygenase HmoA
MVDILIRLKVRDFDVFWEGFQERGASLRQRHGSKGVTALRSQDDPHAVVLHFKWDTRDGFSEFMQDPEVQDSMIKGGVIGKLEVEHLDPVGELAA